MNGSWRTSVEHALLSATDAEGWAADALVKHCGGEFDTQLLDVVNMLGAIKRILAYVDQQSEEEEYLEIVGE